MCWVLSPQKENQMLGAGEMKAFAVVAKNEKFEPMFQSATFGEDGASQKYFLRFREIRKEKEGGKKNLEQTCPSPLRIWI